MKDHELKKTGPNSGRCVGCGARAWFVEVDKHTALFWVNQAVLLLKLGSVDVGDLIELRNVGGAVSVVVVLAVSAHVSARDRRQGVSVMVAQDCGEAGP
jgi:hypothetical protein